MTKPAAPLEPAAAALTEAQVRYLVRSEVFRMMRSPFMYVKKVWNWGRKQKGPIQVLGAFGLPLTGFLGVWFGAAPVGSFVSNVTTGIHRSLNFHNVLAATMDSVPTWLFAASFSFDAGETGTPTVKVPFFALRSQQVVVQYTIQVQPIENPTPVEFRVGPLLLEGDIAPLPHLIMRDSDQGNGCFVVHLDSLRPGADTRLWGLVLQRPPKAGGASMPTIFGNVVIQVIGTPRELIGLADSATARHARSLCPN